VALTSKLHKYRVAEKRHTQQNAISSQMMATFTQISGLTGERFFKSLKISQN